MARLLRIEIENGLYHVTARRCERSVIVRDDLDREDWLRLLDHVATRSNRRVAGNSVVGSSDLSVLVKT